MKSITSFFVLLLLASSSLITAQQQQTPSPLSSAGVCAGPEAYYIPDGRDYRGTVSVTRSGIPCQNWISQEPHPHTTLLDESIGIGNHNYCRNPASDSMSAPWCYTTSASILYESCNVGPPCLGDTRSERTGSVVFSAITSSMDSNSVPVIISPAVISLTSPTFNATMYYTMDNSDAAPTIVSSTVYDPSKKIVIVGSGYITIKAFALRPGFQLSEVTSVTYSILPPSLPAVSIFPTSGTVDTSAPVLVSLSIPALADGASTTDTRALEIRYIVIEGANPDTTTVITPATSLLYVPGSPFWVRAAATVIAASFIPEALLAASGAGGAAGGSRAPSPMTRVFYPLAIAQANPPTVIPNPDDSTTPVEGYGRVVFILDANSILNPFFQVCDIGLKTAPSAFNYNQLICRDIPATTNAFHYTTVGTTILGFRVSGSKQAPSEFVFVKATVLPMPPVRLSVPTSATFVGSVDVSATCLTTYAFLVNGEVRLPPITLSKEGTYVIESYSKTIFDSGNTTRSVITIEAANLPKPVFLPQPSTDVPSDNFVFASPLSVQLRPLSFLAGHAYFVLTVYKVTPLTGERVLIPSMSATNVPTNTSTNMVFEGALATTAATAGYTTYVVSATTFCAVGATDCTLVNQSTKTEVVYNVADRLPADAANGVAQSSPTFLLRVIDGVSPSVITAARIRAALFTTAELSTSPGLSFFVTVSVSGNNAFIQLNNLSPRLAVQYTSWLVNDLSMYSPSRSARAGALRLRLGLESPSLYSPVVSVDSSYKNVGCLSSTALSASLATLHINQITVPLCSAYCFSKFPTKTSMIAVLSPPDRCDCFDLASFDPATGMSNGNFVSQTSLCNNPCGSDVCGGTVDQPANYGLWSSTVCSAYLSFATPSAVRVYPSASAWELINNSGLPFTDSSKKYASSTTSVLTMKLSLNYNNNNNVIDSTQVGRIVMMRKTDDTSCAANAAAQFLAATATSSSLSSSLNAAFTSTFSFLTGISDQGLVLSTVGDYRVCVSFPNQFFNDSNTFVEIDNAAPTASYLEIVQGQYYPVSVVPKPGTYYAASKLTINVSTPAAGAYIKLSVDGSVPTTINSSWTLVVVSGAGSHTILATAVSASLFAGTPYQVVYNLVPQPTINVESAGAYLASARYTFTTTVVGSIRVSLAQYGKIQLGACDQCRVQLLPAGSDCSSLNVETASSASSGSGSSSSAASVATLGPYAAGTFTLDAISASSGSGKSYTSSELMLSAPMNQDPIVVCVGGAPWYEIVPAYPADESRILSVASAGVGFCNNAQQDAMCSSQLAGARCSHVTFSGLDEFGCFCPGYLQKRYTSLFCNNNTNLPLLWNGSILDLSSYGSSTNNGGGGGSDQGGDNGTPSPNSQTAIKASWGAFVVLLIVYGLSLGALWVHKTFRGQNKNTSSKTTDDEAREEQGKLRDQQYAVRVEMVSKPTTEQ